MTLHRIAGGTVVGWHWYCRRCHAQGGHVSWRLALDHALDHRNHRRLYVVR